MEAFPPGGRTARHGAAGSDACTGCERAAAWHQRTDRQTANEVSSIGQLLLLLLRREDDLVPSALVCV